MAKNMESGGCICPAVRGEETGISQGKERAPGWALCIARLLRRSNPGGGLSLSRSNVSNLYRKRWFRQPGDTRCCKPSGHRKLVLGDLARRDRPASPVIHVDLDSQLDSELSHAQPFPTHPPCFENLPSIVCLGDNTWNITSRIRPRRQRFGPPCPFRSFPGL
jgi:hypothetical protein